jgi:hypothetical protein
MKVSDPNIKEFIDFVKQTCKENNIVLKLVNKPAIKLGSDYCGGYFMSDPKPIIVVAVKRPINIWLSILSHEFSHCMQYLEKDITWNKLTINKEKDCITEIWKWLDHQIELPTKKLNNYINRIIDMEYNCDQRSCELIKSFNLPIDIKEYKQKSICYSWFYIALKQHRSWYKDCNSPYKYPEIFTMCPTRWIKNIYNPPTKFIELVARKCF